MTQIRKNRANAPCANAPEVPSEIAKAIHRRSGIPSSFAQVIADLMTGDIYGD